MTAVPEQAPAPRQPPFASASPAEVRAALTPEDAAVFDEQWRTAMSTATDAPDLTVVHAVLDAWRPVAWLTSARGPDAYRRIMARADEALRTGRLPPGSVSLEATRPAIADRLA